MVQITAADTRRETFSDVLEGAQRGEDWAWERVYRALAGPITGYLRSRGAPDPDDLTAEVFFQVARNIGRFSGDESSFRSWVFVIAHRRLIDDRRAAGRRPEVTPHIDPGPDDLVGGNVEDEAIRELTHIWIREILEGLTPSQRDVLVLRIVADLSLEETARAMGKTVGAIKALQRRALLSAQSLIEKRRTGS